MTMNIKEASIEQKLFRRSINSSINRRSKSKFISISKPQSPKAGNDVATSVNKTPMRES